mmetsp:Transcript_3540/g.10274  ORF Transcript_3540/g.10274 Transcript_3540/m.10274 type:complete len:211 (+) Transcript_3540:2319-2951(+)
MKLLGGHRWAAAVDLQRPPHGGWRLRGAAGLGGSRRPEMPGGVRHRSSVPALTEVGTRVGGHEAGGAVGEAARPCVPAQALAAGGHDGAARLAASAAAGAAGVAAARVGGQWPGARVCGQGPHPRRGAEAAQSPRLAEVAPVARAGAGLQVRHRAVPRDGGLLAPVQLLGLLPEPDGCLEGERRATAATGGLNHGLACAKGRKPLLLPRS